MGTLDETTEFPDALAGLRDGELTDATDDDDPVRGSRA